MITGDPSCEEADVVQRHPELTPLRHEELAPVVILFKQAWVEASERPFAKGRSDAFRAIDSYRPGW